jgi:hypothetical protein
MKAQMQQLLGQGDYANMYADAGFAGGNLGDIIAGVEAPIRQKTAQVDTDVLRQTLLGNQTKVVKDPETGKYGIPTGEVVEVEGIGPSARFQMVKLESDKFIASGRGGVRGDYIAPIYGIIDTETGGITKKIGGEKFTNTGTHTQAALDAGKDPAYNRFLDRKESVFKDISKEYRNLSDIAEAEGNEVALLEFDFTNPNTGEPLKEGEVVREGDGMIDLLGDKRNVQELQQVDDFEAYVDNNPDVLADYFRKKRQGRADSKADFGEQHYLTSGKEEGRELIQKNTLADTGRQAGFDAEGNFLGLSAMAEDIQRGNLSRQREADLADVERLSDRFQNVMEDYKPGTVTGIQGARDLLEEQKEAMTTGGGAITIPSTDTYAGDIAGQTMDAATVADPLTLKANTQFTGELATGEGNEGTLRSALLGDAKTALSQGLTDRETRSIQDAARARSTMMGRTFDQSGAIAEAEARVQEDNARRMQNRSFAQSVMGQDAGYQQGDITRGMAQESEQAGLQQQVNLAQAQMDQQANAFGAQSAQSADVANQRQAQQAAQFGVGATMDAERANETLRQQGLGNYINAVGNLARIEDQSTLDPFQALLGRAGGGSLQAGQGVFGQAGYGLNSGPQYLNPEAGLGYISQMAANEANMYGAQLSADATRDAGVMSMIGGIGGGLLGNSALF